MKEGELQQTRLCPSGQQEAHAEERRRDDDGDDDEEGDTPCWPDTPEVSP